MELSLRRWKTGQLLLGWGAYWAGLVGIGAGPAIRATWHATQLPDGHGSANANIDNGVLNYEVIAEGVKTFATTVPLSSVLASFPRLSQQPTDAPNSRRVSFDQFMTNTEAQRLTPPIKISKVARIP